MHNPKSIIGWTLVLGSVALDVVERIDFLSSHLPAKLTAIINQQTIFVTVVVGFLVVIATKSEPHPEQPANSSNAPSSHNSNVNTVAPVIHVNTGPSERELEEKMKAAAEKYSGTSILIDGIGDNDPLIYLDIEPAYSTYPSEQIVCYNKGKTIAHNVEIQPISLVGHTVTFSPIGAISPADKGISVGKMEGARIRPPNNWFTHWLRVESQQGRENVGIWSIPLKIKYSDVANTKDYLATVVLEYDWNRYNYADSESRRNATFNPVRCWEFTQPQFSAKFTNRSCV
jgi:hypothetical protein